MSRKNIAKEMMLESIVHTTPFANDCISPEIIAHAIPMRIAYPQKGALLSLPADDR